MFINLEQGDVDVVRDFRTVEDIDWYRCGHKCRADTQDLAEDLLQCSNKFFGVSRQRQRHASAAGPGITSRNRIDKALVDEEVRDDVLRVIEIGCGTVGAIGEIRIVQVLDDVRKFILRRAEATEFDRVLDRGVGVVSLVRDLEHHVDRVDLRAGAGRTDWGNVFRPRLRATFDSCVPGDCRIIDVQVVGIGREIVGVAIVGVVHALPREVTEELEEQFLALVGVALAAERRRQ